MPRIHVYHLLELDYTFRSNNPPKYGPSSLYDKLKEMENMVCRTEISDTFGEVDYLGTWFVYAF
jgi:hypothetical protein